MLMSNIKLLSGDVVMRAAAACCCCCRCHVPPLHFGSSPLPLSVPLSYKARKREARNRKRGGGRGVGCCQMRISEVELPEERHRRIEARQSINRFRLRLAAGTKIRELGGKSQGSNYYEG